MAKQREKSDRRGLTDFGLVVQGELDRRNITLKHFAKELGISGSYLTDILRGGRQAFHQKQRIVEKLGIVDKTS